jgi:hypothetical protein
MHATFSGHLDSNPKQPWSPSGQPWNS